MVLIKITVNHNLSRYWERRQVVLELVSGASFSFSMREARVVSCFLHSFELSRKQRFTWLDWDRFYLSNGKEDKFFLDGEVFLSKHIVKGYCNIPVVSPFEDYPYLVCRVLPPKKTIENLIQSGAFKNEEELKAKIKELVLAKYQE